MNDPAKVTLRPAVGSDAGTIAQIMRAALGSFDWMPVVHTPDEDLAFIRDVVLPRQQVTVAEAGETIVGFIAVSGDWVEQLYLDPFWTGRAIGRRLLMQATAVLPVVKLHCFQSNTGARRFYATVATRGKYYLIGGDVDNRSAHVIRDGVECPSLSPDGTKLAFKKRMTASGFGVGWQVAVMDLPTSREIVLDAETRSVDDQVEWLDNDHVLYFYPSEAGNNVWALNISNREPPHIFLKDVFSPAVVRQ